MSSDRIEALSRRLADATSRREVLTLVGVGIAGTAVAAVGVSEVRAKKGGSGKNLGPFETLLNIPVSQRDGEQRFRGRLSVIEFVAQGDDIVAVAELTGKVTKKNGEGRKRISRQVRVPVTIAHNAAGVQAQATCEILELFLGPIDLNLLGLRLEVDQIHIRLTADTAGGLLGDLLCAIAGLLDSGGLLSGIIDALNDILDLLRGL